MEYNIAQASRKLRLNKMTIYSRSKKLKVGKKINNRIVFTELELLKIQKNKPIVAKKIKNNRYKISIIDFYLIHSHNTQPEIAQRLGIPVHVVNATINEWINNERCITVNSKINGGSN